MAILTPDYERMQNGQPQDYNTTKQYRKEFADQDIASAQALITNDNNYLVTDADKLNDLCDTINYMQQIWMNDREEFANKYLRMTASMAVGRNLIDPTTINIHQNGITLTPNDDGISMTLNGTATDNFNVVLCNVDSPIPYNNGSIAVSMVVGGLFSNPNLGFPVQSVWVSMDYIEHDGTVGGASNYGEVSVSYLQKCQWKLEIAFSAGNTFDNVRCYPTLTCGVLHIPGVYSYNGDTQYHLNYIYNTGDLVLYNGNPYFCISDNTTGEWDDSKWIKIGDDDVGLHFIGGILEGTTPPPTQNQLYIEQPLQWQGLLPWKYGAEIIGYTHPNIRYLTESETPFVGEIYMTDWNGGGD